MLFDEEVEEGPSAPTPAVPGSEEAAALGTLEESFMVDIARKRQRKGDEDLFYEPEHTIKIEAMKERRKSEETGEKYEL